MALVEGLCAVDSNGQKVSYVQKKKVSVFGSIVGTTCQVNATITYKPLGDSVTEAVFIAGLNKYLQSAIYKCQVDFNGHQTLQTEWWSSEKVSVTRDAQKELEILTQRKEENCYKCIIGDIPVKTEVTVSLSYVYQIPMKDDEFIFSLLSAATPDIRVPCDIFIKLETPGGVAQMAYDDDLLFSVKEIWNKQKEMSYDISLKQPLIQELEVAFRYKCNKVGEVTAVCEHGSGDENSDEFFSKDVAMVTFYPQILTDTSPSSFGEFIFIIDRSGSMRGYEIAHAKDTLLLFLKSLPVGCYFNIISFGSRHEFLFKSGSREYSSDSLKTACNYQNKMDADFGGTSLAPPLADLYKKKPITDHPRKVFILTDGGAWDKPNAIDLVKRNSSTTTVSAFGIGAGADKDMINNLAKAGQGVAEYVEAFDRSMESKVMTALRLSMVACASQFEVKVTPPGGTTAEVLGFRQEAVFSGDACSFGIKLSGEHQTKKKTGKVEVKYRVGDGHYKTSCNLDWGNLNTDPDRHVHRLLASRMMQSMLNKEDMRDKNIQQCYRSYSVSANLGSNSELTKAVTKPAGAANVHGVTETPVTPVYTAPDPVLPGPSTAPVGVPHHTLGRGGARRRGRRILRDNILGITKSTIKRLSRRAGIGRMSSLCNEEIRSILKEFLTKIVEDTVLYAENGKRKLVTEQDVDCALRKNGIKIYGIENRQPLPFEKEDKKRRKVINRSTPFGKPAAMTSVVGSILGISATSKPAMKKTASKTSLKKTPSKTALQKTTSKASLSRTPSNRSIGSDVTLSPPQEENNTRNKREKLQRKSTEILNSSTEDLTLGKAASMVKPALSRVRSAMRNSSSTTQKRRAGGTATGGPPAKVTKGQTQGKGKGNSIKGKSVSKGSGGAAAGSSVAVARVRSVTRGARAPVPGGYKDFTSMVTMVTLQTFDGSWDLSQNLATLIGKPKENLVSACPLKNIKSWATALALCWLEKNFGEQRMEWEMIHYKGNEWLNIQKNPISLENLMKAASKHL